jgi:hypothetical protein
MLRTIGNFGNESMKNDEKKLGRHFLARRYNEVNGVTVCGTLDKFLILKALNTRCLRLQSCSILTSLMNSRNGAIPYSRKLLGRIYGGESCLDL